MFPADGVSLAAGSFSKSSTGIVAVLPSGVVTVAFPLSSTNTVAPGFTDSTAFLILSLTSSFLSPVKSAGVAETLSAGLLMLFPAFTPSASFAVFTKSDAGITSVLPSGVVTVAFPFSSTTTVDPSGFTFATAALIASFSA